LLSLVSGPAPRAAADLAEDEIKVPPKVDKKEVPMHDNGERVASILLDDPRAYVESAGVKTVTGAAKLKFVYVAHGLCMGEKSGRVLLANFADRKFVRLLGWFEGEGVLERAGEDGKAVPISVEKAHQLMTAQADRSQHKAAWRERIKKA